MNKQLVGALVLGCFIAASGANESNSARSSSKGAVVQSAGGAKDTATPLDEQTRLVVFNYDSNLVYNILTQDGMMSHIELLPGETVQGFYISDNTRWRHLVSGDKTRVFIKPTLPGLFNAATLVTSARVYELTFKSGKAGDPWYQRVRWAVSEFGGDSPSGSGFEGVSEFAKQPRVSTARSSLPLSMDIPDMDEFGDRVSRSGRSTGAAVGPKVNPETLNFSYKIEGSASFRPLSVFDDGKFTWVQMSDSPTLPALFLLNEKGEMELVNYTVKGNYMMVSQVVPGLLMRLANEEVRITRKPNCSGFWCFNK